MRAANLPSRAIRRIAYDDDARILSVWFRDSGRYLYFDVPYDLFEGLKSAPSAGRYFVETIKGRYRCRPDPERRRFRPQPAL